MARVGVGSIAAGCAAFAIGFSSYIWLTRDTGPANALARAEVNTAGMRLASLDTGDDFEFAFKALDNQPELLSARSSFGERFSFDQSDAPGASFQSAQVLASFDDRFSFNGEGPAPDAAGQSAVRPVVARAAVASVIPLPRAAVRAVAAQAAPKRAAEARFQLASASETSLPLAYAPTDAVKGAAVTGSIPKDAARKESDPLAGDMSHTAIYDITARTVYLPDGRRLEAHSGLGGHMDDVRYVHQRMTGPTPPNVYDLRMRESLFHGVRAIRLVPTDDSKMHGRAGILAHTYMLGPNGQSNGCVSFSDYPAFLDAFLRGDVNRLVVVERLAEPPPPRTASDWFKDLFRRS